MARILIAEDDSMQSSLLQAAMEARGHEAVAVSNGLDAVRRLQQERFDIALLDYHLPDVDGFAAAQLMREFGTGRHPTQVIALTASAEQLAARQQGMGKPSFHAVVSKRQGLPALMGVVDDHLAIVAQHHSAASAARAREAVFQRRTLRRRRLTAPFMALPALVVAGVFAFSLMHTSQSLTMLDMEKARTTDAALLRHNTGGIVDAMNEVRMAEQAYRLTGAAAQKGRFYTSAGQLDRLLSSRGSLRADGLPGTGPDAPQAITDPLVRRFADAVEHRGGAGNPVVVIAATDADTAIDGLATIQPLRNWVERLLSSSQTMLLNGLDSIRGNILVALVALALGLAYGLWNAASVFRRSWINQDVADVSMRAASGFEFRTPAPVAGRDVRHLEHD